MAGIKKLLWVLAVPFSAALLASCGSGSQVPAGIYGNPPALEEYISTLRQGYRDYVRRGIFFFQGTTPADEPAYRAIVDRYEETGLEALSTEDRYHFLLVAQIAFLSYADTLRYSVAVAEDDGDADGTRQVDALLEEVYSLDHERFIAARRLTGTGVIWPWPVWASRDQGSPAESRQFFDRPVDDPDGSWFVPETVWSKRNDEWSCVRTEIDDITWAFGYGAYLESFRALGLGALFGRDSVGGQPAYKFSGTGAEQRDVTYWLDAETLWLRQYQYEDDGIHYTVRLEAVNEDIVIEPPDVDVECEEEEAE